MFSFMTLDHKTSQKTGFVVQGHICCVTYDLEQWYSNLARKIHFPAEFSSKTHLPVIF